MRWFRRGAWLPIFTCWRERQGKSQCPEKLTVDLNNQFQRDFPNVFYRVDVVDELYRGAVSVAQSYGLGTFEANTVLVGWPNEGNVPQTTFKCSGDLIALDKTVMVLRYDPKRRFGNYRRIQIWWGDCAVTGDDAVAWLSASSALQMAECAG